MPEWHPPQSLTFSDVLGLVCDHHIVSHVGFIHSFISHICEWIAASIICACRAMRVSTKSCVDGGLRMHHQIIIPQWLFYRVIKHPFRCAQQPGPIFYVTYIEQDVPYVAVHFFVCSFDYAINFPWVRYRSMMCDTVSWWKCVSKLTKCDLKSITSSSSAIKRHVCRLNVSAAAIAVTSYFGNNSLSCVKVSMITIMYFSPISEGKGPIVSMEVLSIG